MPSQPMTVAIRAKPVVMEDSSHCMTRGEIQGALYSLRLFTLPLCNLCEITAQIASDTVRGATDPDRAHLMFTPQVVTGLATLQSAVQDLSRAYIAHTNTVLGKGSGSSLELLNFANPIGGENGLFSGRLATPGPAPVAEQGEVKKRKRAPHDKNAPKRPVTPYFLYMQYAREGIAKEMGPSAPAKQVADEGTRRWNTMPDSEKADFYGCNFAAYKKKVQAYKAGLPIPEVSHEEAKALHEEEKKTGAPPAPVQEASSDHEDKSESEDDSDESSSSSEDEPPKAPSPPKSPRTSKRGKGAKEKAAKKAAPVEKPAPVERSNTTPEVDKKKKTTKKKDAPAVDAISERRKIVPAPVPAEVEASPALSKKDGQSKPKRKKRKSEAVDA
ncbi:MAG: hypothetical protein Q9183_000433 [Haloplaca sp. 2 TL-2023]